MKKERERPNKKKSLRAKKKFYSTIKTKCKLATPYVNLVTKSIAVPRLLCLIRHRHDFGISTASGLLYICLFLPLIRIDIPNFQNEKKVSKNYILVHEFAISVARWVMTNKKM